MLRLYVSLKGRKGSERLGHLEGLHEVMGLSCRDFENVTKFFKDTQNCYYYYCSTSVLTVLNMGLVDVNKDDSCI